MNVTRRRAAAGEPRLFDATLRLTPGRGPRGDSHRARSLAVDDGEGDRGDPLAGAPAAAQGCAGRTVHRKTGYDSAPCASIAGPNGSARGARGDRPRPAHRRARRRPRTFGAAGGLTASVQSTTAVLPPRDAGGEIGLGDATWTATGRRPTSSVSSASCWPTATSSGRCRRWRRGSARPRERWRTAGATTRRRAAAATSTHTTISATSSSGCSSTRDLLYSCALFESPADSLEAAQVNKLRAICDKLALGPGDHVLEIGSGWGGFALFAATRYGCRVTTTTISAEQHAHVADGIARAGDAGQRIDLRFEDYRELRGRFDKIVSIEMFEAVGLAHYDDYFAACDRLLDRDGVMLLQTITVDDWRFAEYRSEPNWISKRIFPGAELASVGEILASLTRSQPDDPAPHAADRHTLRAHPALLARALQSPPRTRCVPRVLTTASSGCGICISLTVRRRFSTGTSATCSYSSPNPPRVASCSTSPGIAPRLCL